MNYHTEAAVRTDEPAKSPEELRQGARGLVAGALALLDQVATACDDEQLSKAVMSASSVIRDAVASIESTYRAPRNIPERPTRDSATRAWLAAEGDFLSLPENQIFLRDRALLNALDDAVIAAVQDLEEIYRHCLQIARTPALAAAIGSKSTAAKH